MLYRSESQRSGKNCEGDDGDEPTKKSDDVAERDIIGLDFLHLPIFDNQHRSESRNSNDD